MRIGLNHDASVHTVNAATTPNGRYWLLADGAILIACVIWGTTLVFQRTAMDHMGPLAFTGFRWLVGFFAVAVFAWVLRGRPPVVRLKERKGLLVGGLLCGIALAFATSLQQIGLKYTTAGNAGFVTGMYVVFVPVFGLFGGRRAPFGTWAGCALTIVGLYLLSVSTDLEINRGDLWVLGSAVCWAWQILLIETFARRFDVLDLAAVEFAVCGVLSSLAALLIEQISVSGVWAAAWSLLFAGVLSSGVAFTLQVIAQRYSPSAHASIIMSTEGVFAALAGWLMLSEMLQGRAITGCVLMLTGVVFSQLASGKSARQPLTSALESDMAARKINAT